ncbi:MAG: hypothetical protein ACI3XM_03270, partial [Eubacteriales bacterium]
MEYLTYEFWGSIRRIPCFTYHTLIVGTGAAGYNAADSLYEGGKKKMTSYDYLRGAGSQLA